MLQLKVRGAKIGAPRWQPGSRCAPQRQDPALGRLSHLPSRFQDHSHRFTQSAIRLEASQVSQRSRIARKPLRLERGKTGLGAQRAAPYAE